MNSKGPKSRNSKAEKPIIRKMTLVSSKFKTEESEDKLNARRYNLRSNSPLKTPIQLTSSKRTDSEKLTKNSIKKFNTKDKTPVNLKNVCSPKKVKDSSCSPSKISQKIERNSSAKRQIPKYIIRLPETETENIYEESKETDFGIKNTFPRYKSILKRVQETKSPIKNSNLRNISEKDSIKERIYGTNVIRQKKVKFVPMSCHNLEVLSYENNSSEELKETVKMCDEMITSPLTGTNIRERIFCESASIDNDSGLVRDHMLPLNEDVNTNEKSLETHVEERNLLPFENTVTSEEPPTYFKANTKIPETSCDKSPTLGLFCTNITKANNTNFKIRDENVKKQHSNDEKLLNNKGNKIPFAIENFKILNEVKAPEASEKCNTLQENRVNENLEIPYLECGDPGNEFKFMAEKDCTITEKTSNIIESDVFEGTNNSMHDPFMFHTMQKSPAQNKEDQERIGRKDLLINEVDNQVSRLTMKFLQEMNKSENIKRKRPSTNYAEIGVAQIELEKKNEFSFKPKEEEDILLHTAKTSKSGESNAPQKTLPFHKTPKLDLNKSDFRRPSKIPRLKSLMYRGSPFSPSSKFGSTPIKAGIFEDEITQKQRDINYHSISEDEVNKREDLNEEMLTSDNSVLSEEHEIINNWLENSVIVNDGSSIPDSPICDQEEDVTLVGKDVLPERHEDFVSCISEDECDLLNNSPVDEREINDAFLCRKEDDSKILKETNSLTCDNRRTSNFIRRESDDFTNKEKFCSSKICEKESEASIKKPVFKRRKDGIFNRRFILNFFICLVLFIFISKMFGIPSDDN